MLVLLRRMTGGELTVHGFRSSFNRKWRPRGDQRIPIGPGRFLLRLANIQLPGRAPMGIGLPRRKSPQARRTRAYRASPKGASIEDPPRAPRLNSASKRVSVECFNVERSPALGVICNLF